MSPTPKPGCPVTDRPAPEQHLTRRVVVPSSISVVVAFGCVLYGFSVYATDQAAGSVFTTSLLSVAYAGAVIASGLSSIPVGRYLDRHGVNRVIVAGGLLVGAGLWWFSRATEPWMVIVAWWGLIGPGTAALYYEPTFVAINQWVPEEQRPRALGWLTVIGGLAGAIFIPLLERLTAWLGWRNAIQIAALIVFVSALMSGLMLLPKGRGPYAIRQSLPGALSGLIRDRVFVWYTAAMILAFVALQGVIVHRLDVFAEAGFSLALVAAWAGGASLISLPGRYAGPVIGDRTSLVGAMVGVLVLMAVSTGLAATPSSLFAMVAHFAIFGLAFGAVTPLRALMMNRWYAGDRFGTVMAIQHTATLLAGSLGPLIVGIGRDSSGSYAAPLYVITSLIVAAAACVMAAGSAHRRRMAAQSR